eukprot:scaffold246358_cov50-Prasinocladus_malaysianus.AAC.1
MEAFAARCLSNGTTDLWQLMHLLKLAPVAVVEGLLGALGSQTTGLKVEALSMGTFALAAGE